MKRNNIEAERGRLQITKEEMAKMLGVTSQTYLAYTRGRPIPSPVLIKMSRLFRCTVDYLLDNHSSEIKGA